MEREQRGTTARSRVLALMIVGVAALCACAHQAHDRGPEPLAHLDGPEKHYSQVRGDGLAPRVPNPWFFLERAYPFGTIPREHWRMAQAQAAAHRVAVSGTPATWTQRGPTNIGGRITDIAVHPLDGDIVYAGAAEGGVLRSTDGGQSWTPLFDDQPSISIGAVAIDPSNPDVIYAGTGEVNPGGGSVAYGGAGLFRSEDQGETWEFVGLEDSGAIGRIRIDPTDPDRIFVAVMGFLWETNPERGVYRTTNGGTTWERVHYVADDTGCVDLIMRPDDPDVLYAAMWQRLRQPEFYDYGGPNCAVYRTLDGGDNWTLVGGGLPAPNANDGRIGLSLCASQPEVMHAVYADRTGFFDGLYRSTDGGFTWSQTNDGSLSSAFASYGWWFGNVRTHPVDPDTIFVLGLNFYRSTNGGGSYSNTSGGMHVDHHGLDFGPGASPVIYNGNDGGVYRSTNGGTVWTKLFDLPVTQAYRIALDAGNPNARYLGAQDNGTNRTLTGGTGDWTSIYGGD
ncbi:MAG: WD40/YVTN/BNR-like repeat-containing protein, partial [Planctomycetota bacterium]